MAFIDDLALSGIEPGRHHDDEWRPAVRIVRHRTLINKYHDSGKDAGIFEVEEDSTGDEINWLMWEHDSEADDDRRMPGWSMAFPAILDGEEEGGDVATQAAGGGEKNKCASFSRKHTALPVKNDEWEADERFKTKKVKLPDKDDQKTSIPPRGSFGIMLAGTEEYEQHDLFFPVDSRLFAVHAGGDPKMGTLVCDVNSEHKVDPERRAPLQAMLWVVEPLGTGPTIAWNIGPSGCEDVLGGYVIDEGENSTRLSSDPGDQSTLAVETVVAASRVIGAVSKAFNGPFDVGTGKCDHQLDEDRDGNPIVSLHIQSQFLLRADDTRDGPLLIENFQEGEDHKKKVRVHFGFDYGTKKWRWWTTSPFQLIPVTVPPVRFDFTPFRPDPITRFDGDYPPHITGGGGGTPGGDPDGGRPSIETPSKSRRVGPVRPGVPSHFVGTDSQIGSPGNIAWPQNWNDGQTDTTDDDTSDEEAEEKRKDETPVTGAMSSFGAQGGTAGNGDPYSDDTTGGYGDPWAYTTFPGQSRFRGGTAQGGWCFHSPEINLADIKANGMAPAWQSLSTVYVTVARTAYFACGMPELSNGTIQDGYSWGCDFTTGDLLFRSHTASAAPINAVKFTNSGQNICWRSGTNFWGCLEHAITADRTWTFPDKSGTVAMITDVSGGTGLCFDNDSAPADEQIWCHSAQDDGTYDFYIENDAGSLLASVYQVTRSGAGPVAFYFPTVSVQLSESADVSTPALSWPTDPDSGRYRIGADDYGEAVAGNLVYEWTGTVFTTYQQARVGTTTLTGSQGDWAAGLTGAGEVFWDVSAKEFLILTSTLTTGVTGNPAMALSGTAPQIYFDETDGASNRKIWNLRVAGNQMILDLLDDSGSATTGSEVFKISRVTNILDEVVWNDEGAAANFRWEGDTLQRLFYIQGDDPDGENVAFFSGATTNFQNMDRGFYIADAEAAPSGDPSSGGFLYSNSGALTWRGAGGHVTILAGSASGPYTQNYVLYGGSDGNPTESANLTFDGSSLIVTGTVGIGESTPDAKLEIASTTEQLRLSHTAGSVYASFTVNSSGDLTIAPTGGSVGVGTSGPDANSLTMSGKVFRLYDDGAVGALFGIISDDQSPWHFSITNETWDSSATLNNGLRLFVDNSGNGWISAPSSATAGDGDLRLYTDNTLRLAILSTGNVGVNTSTPDAQLEVASTTEQARLSYTAGSVYSSFTVDSSGDLTINVTGTGVIISDALEIDGALNHDGSTLGVFGTAPATKQEVTGARDDPESALANLLTALEAYGLITDSTTAS